MEMMMMMTVRCYSSHPLSFCFSLLYVFLFLLDSDRIYQEFSNKKVGFTRF